MKIAQVAPLYESVPPKSYGGTERVVSYLTEELVKLGHDVTLYASGDSVTQARLKAQCPQSLRTQKKCQDAFVHHALETEHVFKDSPSFDMIHSHIDYHQFSLGRRSKTPFATTLHGRLDIPDLYPLYREFTDIPLVSISDSQRKPLPWVNWIGTVYHGLPKDLYQFNPTGADYLAYVGRISPEKRVDRAIEIAKKIGMKLKIAAKIDKVDVEYFKEIIEPLLDHPLIEFIGEIDQADKNDFLGNAHAVLFPIDWPEPFGLVMIEAMACGTPVIAANCGSVPEVMTEEETGFIIQNVDEAVKAVKEVSKIDRRHCRQVFEERFTSERMALDYISLYEQVIAARQKVYSVNGGKSWRKSFSTKINTTS